MAKKKATALFAVAEVRLAQANSPLDTAIAWVFAPILLVGACIFFPFYWLWLLLQPTQEEQDIAKTDELVAKAHEMREQLPPQTTPVFHDIFEVMTFSLDGKGEKMPARPIVKALKEVAERLYLTNDVSDPVKVPVIKDGIEGARARDRLREQVERIKPENINLAKDTIADALSAFIAHLPPAVFFTLDELKQDSTNGVTFNMMLVDMLPNAGQMVTAMQRPFYADSLDDTGLFVVERWHHWKALFHMSGKDAPLTAPKDMPKLTHPFEHKGSNREIVGGYLYNSPMFELFKVEVPFTIPHVTRFEHQWIISPTGTGKSTTLSAFILKDLDLVAKGEASVIVMESNRDLIKSIEGLKRFAPGGDLAGRLVVIDVEDVDYPIAINLFDVGLKQINQASSRDKEALLNSAVAMLDYVFRALLSAELTSRQSTLFNFTIQLLIHVEGATLDTFIDLMQPKAIRKQEYQDALALLDSDARMFFDLKFDSKEFEQTKSQVTDRLFAVKRIRSLSRMFSAKKTKLDLFKEMGEGKVILINLASSLLGKDGVEILGRFFVAMALFSAEKRQLLAKGDRLDTFFYIDEAHAILHRDEKISSILDECRKYRLGMIIAGQRIEQYTPPVINALMGSTAIKFASQVSDSNASALARNMGTTPDFILNQQKYSYAVSIRGHTQNAISLAIPLVELGKMPRMTEEEANVVRDDMRRRYAFEYQVNAPTDAREVEVEVVDIGVSKRQQRRLPRVDNSPQDDDTPKPW